MQRGKVIYIASYLLPMPAHLDKSLLESEEIPAMVQEGQVVPNISFFDQRGPVRLLVNEEDLDKALKVLAQHPNSQRELLKIN